MNNVRTNIEAERARLQMTKREIAARLGITDSTYRAYINGSPIPSDILEKLHVLTGASIDYLLNLKRDR